MADVFPALWSFPALVIPAPCHSRPLSFPALVIPAKAGIQNADSSAHINRRPPRIPYTANNRRTENVLDKARSIFISMGVGARKVHGSGTRTNKTAGNPHGFAAFLFG